MPDALAHLQAASDTITRVRAAADQLHTDLLKLANDRDCTEEAKQRRMAPRCGGLRPRRAHPGHCQRRRPSRLGPQRPERPSSSRHALSPTAHGLDRPAATAGCRWDAPDVNVSWP
jgi:hypothetical protein